jgi:hypothetical protein
MTLMFKCTLEQAELEEEYMGLYTKGANDNGPYICSDFTQQLPCKYFQV